MARSTSEKTKETFSINAPQAQSVLLAGTFTAWQEGAVALKRQKSGVWKGTVALAPGRHEYRFIVDGEWQDDPDCAARVSNGVGSENCVRDVAAA